MGGTVNIKGIKCNLELLEPGKAIADDMKINLESFKKKINKYYNVDLANVGNQYKVDFSDVNDLKLVSECFTNIIDNLEDTKSIASKNIELIEAYSNGDFSGFVISDGQTYEDALKTALIGTTGLANGNTGMRIVSTVGMALFMTAEGFLDFFEDVGDAVVLVGSGFMSMIGEDDIAKSWADYASKNIIVDILEDNKVFHEINQNSYYDRDSAYANMFRLAGAGTAAVVFGHTVSSLTLLKSGSALTKTAGSVKKVTDAATHVGSTTSTLGSNITTNLNSGYSLNKALFLGATVTGLTFGVSKGVADPLGNKVGEVVKDTKFAENASKVFNNKATQKVTEKLEDDLIETGKNIANSSVEMSAKQVKSSSSNLVEDGDDRSVQDMGAESAAKGTVDTFVAVSKNAMKSIMK